MDDMMVWTDEDIRYLLALQSWVTTQPAESNDERQPVSFPRADVEIATAAFRFLVLGSKGCGKTSLLDRFGEGAFAVEPHQEHVPKVSLHGRSCCHSIRIGHENYMVDVLELPSQDVDNAAYLKQAIDITEAAVLIYDITSRASFSLAESLCRSLLNNLAVKSTKGAGDAREYALVLVGNRSDCDDEDRRVPWAEGYRLAASLPLRCSFLEASAQTGDNVVKVFQQLGTDLLQIKWLVQQRREAEAIAAATHQDCHLVSSSSTGSPTRRTPRWKKSWTLPQIRRKFS